MSQYVSFRQLTYRGAWRTDAPYRPGDFVTYSEGLYVCLQPNLGQLPTDTDYWDKLSQPAGTGPPSAHASTHQNGGGDEVATETPAAYAIPKAGAGGKLSNSWLSTGTGNGLDADTVDGSHASAFQPVDAELTAIAGLTSAADLGIYFTGSGAAATFTLTAAARTLLAAATATDQRSALGLVIGTNVQAQNANLQAIADLTTAADKLNYWTGSGTTALTDLTAAGRALIGGANAAAQRTSLGLGASDSPTLTGLTLSGMTATRVPFLSTGGLLVDSANMTFGATYGLTLGAGSTSALQLSSTAGTALGGILFGTDVTLYRVSANVLKTDDALIVASNFTNSVLTSGRVPYASTGGLLVDSANLTFDTVSGIILAAGSTSALKFSSTAGTAAGGLVFASDTNLFRSAADVLRSNDSLWLDGSITARDAIFRVPAATNAGFVWYNTALAVNKWWLAYNSTNDSLTLYHYTDAGVYDGVAFAINSSKYFYAPRLSTDSSYTYTWTLAGYTGGAPSATGYVTITINGTTYKLLAST